MILVDYSAFFKELAQNNHKDWFHANKKRYEQHVKTPFLAILDKVLPELTGWDGRILNDPKKALFRINRDIRFSKDKSPYNLIMKAGFSPGGKKSELPGYYLGIDAEHIHVGGGLFMLSTPALKNVRHYIAKHPNPIKKIIESPDFKSTFGTLRGEKAKRLDKTLLAAAEKTDLIYHKQFYTFAEFPLAPFYNSEKLVDEILAHFRVVKPLNDYLNQALI